MLRRGTRLALCLFILLHGALFFLLFDSCYSLIASFHRLISRVFVFLRNHFDYRVLSLSAGFSLAFGFAGLIRTPAAVHISERRKRSRKERFQFSHQREMDFLRAFIVNLLEMLSSVFSELVEIETFNWFSSSFALFLKSQKTNYFR